LKQLTDLLATNDGRSPVPEKDGIIGVELKESVRVSRFKGKGKLLVK
jgi:hypothetical protein